MLLLIDKDVNVMQKRFLFIFSILFSVTYLFAAPENKSSDKDKVMYVAIESLSVKTKASITGKEIGILNYGDKVIVTNEKGSWSKISFDKETLEGWVNTSSLTKKKIIASENKVSTNANELALAGKGLNSTVEATYGVEYEINYDLVDEIENNQVSEEEVIEFIEEGKLLLVE